MVVLRDGMERLTISEAGCPTRPSVDSSVFVELEEYTERRSIDGNEIAAIEVDDHLAQSFEPIGGNCDSAGVMFIDGKLTINGALRTTCNPAADAGCRESLRDLLLIADDLVFEQTYAGPTCDRTTRLRGKLFTSNTPRAESFEQTFRNFQVIESVSGNARLVSENGRVVIDCLGEVEFRTAGGAELLLPPATACPEAGALEVLLLDAMGGGSVSVPERARQLAQDGGGSSSLSETGGLLDFGFRAASGAVYQILQNPRGNPEIRSEDVRVTTVVGSLDGIDRCDSTSLGANDAQAVVATAPGQIFPIEGVRVSSIISNATTPCFNPNGAEGRGLVCIGAQCSADCRCPSGGCVTFSLGSGSALADPGLLDGRSIESLASFSGACSGFAGRSTYGFRADQPTLSPGLCGAAPLDGFTLGQGQSIVVAYPAPPTTEFFSGAAGFPIGRQGDNNRGCLAGRVLTGVSTRNELGPAVVTFGGGGSVAFDVNADDTIDRSVPSCEQLSIAECGAPPPTPTPTPDIPRRCPETSLDAPVQGTTVNAFDVVGGATCGDGGNAAPDRTYRFTAPTDGCYRFDTGDTSGLADPFDTILYVRRGGDDCDGAELACNDNTDATNTQSEVFVQLQTGQSVVIAVDGNAGESGAFRLGVERGAQTCAVTVTPTVPEDATATSTPEPTNTPSNSPTRTTTSPGIPTSTIMPTATRTFTEAPTDTATPTPSPTPSPSPTGPTFTPGTPTASPTMTPTAAASTVTSTTTRTPTRTRTATRTPTLGLSLVPQLVAVAPGGEVMMTASLGSPAPADTTVTLGIADPTVASLPAQSVVILAGKTAASFVVRGEADGVTVLTASGLGAAAASVYVTQPFEGTGTFTSRGVSIEVQEATEERSFSAQVLARGASVEVADSKGESTSFDVSLSGSPLSVEVPASEASETDISVLVASSAVGVNIEREPLSPAFDLPVLSPAVSASVAE